MMMILGRCGGGGSRWMVVMFYGYYWIVVLSPLLFSDAPCIAAARYNEKEEGFGLEHVTTTSTTPPSIPKLFNFGRDLHHDDDKIRNRRLQSGVTCELTEEVYRFTQDPITLLYGVVLSENSETPIAADDVLLSGVSQYNNTHDSLMIPSRDVEGRACACTRRFRSNRAIDFCPVSFAQCIYRSADDLVSCISPEPVNILLKAIWAVAMVALILLAYGWCFTEPGKHARQYIRRTLHFRNAWSTPQERLDDERSRQSYVDQLLTNEPERAAYMYRHYMIREQERQRRRQQQQQAQWQRRIVQFEAARRPPPAPPEVAATIEEGTTDGGEAHPITSPTPEIDNSAAATVEVDLRPRLKLKTKVYRTVHHRSNKDDDDESDLPKSPAAPQIHSWGLPLTLLQNNNTMVTNRNNESVDSATFDVMDEETERGTRCAICLSRLREGDIIGDIACSHSMHKDCLKDWLPRKNCCPMCRTADIALLLQPPSSAAAVSPSSPLAVPPDATVPSDPSLPRNIDTSLP